MDRKLPVPKYSLRSHLLVLSGATFLLCAGVILLFFPLLNRNLGDLLDKSIDKMREAKEGEATTVARLMVLEFSQLRELLEVKPGSKSEVDQRIMNLIWQKVTFNESIEGIELIQAKSDAQGRHLTYRFYRREDPELRPMSGVEKKLEDFIDGKTKKPRLEKALIDSINSRQTVDKSVLDSVNRGPKEEGQMLFRYLPVHVLVPEEGAIYWGVAKIGVDISGITQLLALQSKEQNALRKAIWLGIIMSLTISGILAVSLLYLWAISLTEPLRTLSKMAREFKTAKPPEYHLWLDNLERVDPRGQTEVADLKDAMVRLGKAVPRLGERLFASEHQACLSRVAARALPVLQADSQKLADWQRFTVNPDAERQTFDLSTTLASAWSLIVAGVPPGAELACELGTLPPVWGSPGYLVQAVLSVLEYAQGILASDGRLLLTAGPGANRGLKMVVAVTGKTISPQDCEELLEPLDPGGDLKGSLGPALAAAIARQHGGDLTVSPGDPQGLIFTLTLPPAPLDHGNRKSSDT